MTFGIPVEFLRGLSNSFLPDSCSILRNTPASSGDGPTDSWSTVATVACRLSPLASGTNTSVGGTGGIDEIAQWTVWLPAGTDVTVQDRLSIGSRTFEISRVGARSYEVTRECLCHEVT